MLKRRLPLSRLSPSSLLPLIYAAAVAGLTLAIMDCGILRAARADQEFLGFTYRDVPLYYTYAREVFDRGDGWLRYPNPYEWERQPDRVYCQFFLVLCGWLWRMGIPFPALDQILRAVCGAGMIWLLWGLARRFLPHPAFRVPVLLCASLSGGVAWAVAAGVHWATGADYFQAFAAIERGYHDWFYLWRQLFFATECFYHCLAFAVFLCLMTGRYGASLALLFLTWWSHPFTGLQTGAITSLFLTFALLRRARRRSDWRWWWAALALNAAWCAYYGPFLGAFESHRAMMRRWEYAALPVYWDEVASGEGLWIALSVPALLYGRFRRWATRTRPGRLWMALLLVTSALIAIQRFPFLRQANQPIHYTRGYISLALIVSAMWSVRLIAASMRWRPRTAALAAGGALLALTLPDQALFLRQYFKVEMKENRVALIPRADGDVIRWFEAVSGVRRIAVIEANPTGGLDYLLPLFTPHMTALGHIYNSTNYERKRWMIRRYWVGESDSLLKEEASPGKMKTLRKKAEQADDLFQFFDPDYIVQPRDRPTPRSDGKEWNSVYRNGAWAVYANAK